MENRHHAGIVRCEISMQRFPRNSARLVQFQFWCSLAVTLLEIGYMQPFGESPYCVSLLLRALASSDPEFRNLQKILLHSLFCQPRDTAIQEKCLITEIFSAGGWEVGRFPVAPVTYQNSANFKIEIVL